MAWNDEALAGGVSRFGDSTQPVVNDIAWNRTDNALAEVYARLNFLEAAVNLLGVGSGFVDGGTF